MRKNGTGRKSGSQSIKITSTCCCLAFILCIMVCNGFLHKIRLCHAQKFPKPPTQRVTHEVDRIYFFPHLQLIYIFLLSFAVFLRPFLRLFYMRKNMGENSCGRPSDVKVLFSLPCATFWSGFSVHKSLSPKMDRNWDQCQFWARDEGNVEDCCTSRRLDLFEK